MAATKKKKKAKKSGVVRGKRKEATARVLVTKGKGRVYFNGVALSALTSAYVRHIVSEPLRFVDANAYDVNVTVRGGGTMGQAQAARVAIANALVVHEGDALKTAYMAHDRSLLVEDSRRVEPKKFRGPKARARFTKSYR
ncbi:MAG: 30S ribosomal protein S9 [Candidatus Micrarchaeota archaeon]|nr:30S ribosomal protein S9 [Candidatus Micrarchaeota archaeon]